MQHNLLTEFDLHLLAEGNHYDNYEKLGKTDEAILQWKKALEVETSAAYPDETVTERLQKKLDAARNNNSADGNKK